MTTSSSISTFLSRILRVGLPLALLAIGAYAYSVLSVEPEEEKSPPVANQVIRTNVTELQIRDYPVVVTTHGIVQAHNEVTLSAEVSGLVQQISSTFEAGSYFSEGDVLLELDDRDYKTRLAVAEARVLSAQASVQLANENFDRIKSLYDRNVSTEAEVNLASATSSQAVAELNTAEADVEQAKRDLERTKIRAPFDGRVRHKAIGLGQSIGQGTTLGVVFAIDFAEVRLPIAGPELQFLELPELASDPPVEVELRDAISETNETVWNAKIIRTEGTLDQDSLELFAIARIDDPFGRESVHPPLRIGQPVVGSIAGKVLKDVIALPRMAVRQLDQVILVDNSELTLIPRTIEPIWSDEEFVIVRDSSIQNGAWLSTTHLVYAPEGAKVEIIPDIEQTTTAAKTNVADDTESVAN